MNELIHAQQTAQLRRLRPGAKVFPLELDELIIGLQFRLIFGGESRLLSPMWVGVTEH